MAAPERWSVEHDGHHHELTVEPSGLGHTLTWTRDGEPVAERRTSDDHVQLTPGGDGPEDAGAIGIRFAWFGPARRVTLFENGDELDAEARAVLGLGGVDLDPEPGSAAARRAAWIREHPRLYTARQTLVAIAAVVVPLLLAGLVARFVLTLPWPDWDLPRIPWPRIPWPRIPWPTIPWPEVPWPDIRWPLVPWPDISLPGWMEQVLSWLRYVVPVAIAFFLARREVRRHRERAARRADNGSAAAGGRGRPANRSRKDEDRDEEHGEESG